MMGRLNSYFLTASVLLLFLLSSNVISESGNDDGAGTGSDDIPTAVSPPNYPTEVTIGAYLIGLSRVSAPSEAFPSFEVEMFIDLSWKDERLAFSTDEKESAVFLEEEAEEKLSEIWSPDMDLRRFPFDEQIFDIEIQSFVWDKNDIILKINEEQLGMDPDFHTPEWTVLGVKATHSLRSEIRDDRDFSTFLFRINAERHSGHYMLRILMPLMFVMLLTWIAFWITPADQIRLGFIVLLTVVATHTVISNSLPRLHYPTFSDILLTICYLFATTLILESTVVRNLGDNEKKAQVEKIDQRTRWLLPVGALVVLGISVIILWLG
jgi:hypothetical protein